jgi:hypothetical protein
MVGETMLLTVLRAKASFVLERAEVAFCEVGKRCDVSRCTSEREVRDRMRGYGGVFWSKMFGIEALVQDIHAAVQLSLEDSLDLGTVESPTSEHLLENVWGRLLTRLSLTSGVLCELQHANPPASCMRGKILHELTLEVLFDTLLASFDLCDTHARPGRVPSQTPVGAPDQRPQTHERRYTVAGEGFPITIRVPKK